MRMGRAEEDLLGQEGQKQVSFGLPNPAQEQCSSLDIDICPDLILAAAAVFGAIALLVLYMAITANANGRRRRRSLVSDGTDDSLYPPFLPHFIAVLTAGW